MIYRLSERNTGLGETQRDIKKGREESGKEEGRRELRELIILFNHILDEGQVVCGTESETERDERGEECEGNGERGREGGGGGGGGRKKGRERWRNKWKEREGEDEKGTYGERERGDESESRTP